MVTDYLEIIADLVGTTSTIETLTMISVALLLLLLLKKK